MSWARLPHHHIRITKSILQDKATWLQFLEHFNGVVYFPDSEWATPDSLQLYTDSAGSGHLGCGSFFQGQWVHVTFMVKHPNIAGHNISRTSICTYCIGLYVMGITFKKTQKGYPSR